MKSTWTTLGGVTILAASLSLTACGGGGGSGSSTNLTTSGSGPAQPVAVVDVKSEPLAAGSGYSLGINAAGQIQSWGATVGTQPATNGWKSVGAATWASSLHASWAIDSNGTLAIWGMDAAGVMHDQPVQLTGLGAVASARACGTGTGALLLALGTDGVVRAVPASELSTTAKGITVSGLGEIHALSDGMDTTCGSVLAIDKQGAVSRLTVQTSDTKGVPTALAGAAVSGLSNVVQASCAQDNCLAVTKTGAVYGWGSNAKGQLGDTTLDPRSTPAQVDMSLVGAPAINQVLVTQAGAAYAIGKDGALYGWGAVDGLKVLTSSAYPGTVPTLLMASGVAVSQIAVSPDMAPHTLIQAGDGSVYGWGRNADAEVAPPASAKPLLASTFTNIVLK
ncbi:MAG: hypothetical protein KGN37_10240 [Burkholderiales bacterium]|nr:hypothetical protein [Burkholderiales bacterium]